MPFFRSLTTVTLVATTLMLGCETTPEPYTPPTPPQAMRPLPNATGFLLTYKNLEQVGPSSLRYIDPNNRLARYNKFWLKPVEIRWYHEGVNVSEENQRMLSQAFYDAFVEAMSGGYEIVTSPAFDAAEVRIALTDVQRSTPILNVIPRLKIADLGLGGLAMEAEVRDSESGVQIAALVESSVGRNLSWNTTQFDDAIGAMKDWASRFRAAVDAAHAKKAGG